MPDVRHICLYCGKEFFTFQSTVGKYCSKRCYGLAKTITRVHVNCKICNKDIPVLPSRLLSGKDIFCSRKCKETAAHLIAIPNKIKRNCLTCGKEFFTFPSTVKIGRGKYCSKACCGKSLVGKKSRRWAYGKVERTCVVCGKNFASIPSRVLSHGGKYCSKACSDVGLRKKITVVCEICGIAFTIIPSENARGVGRCCSKKCMGVLYKKEKLGQNNPMWNGGSSFEPYCPKFTDELKECVRDKFGRKCVVCGQPENGRALSVHHVDYNKMQGCQGQRWKLITLCNRCHIQTNRNRWYWFNLLINYWAQNEEINLHDDYYIT
jgi:hypothetical protein